MNRRGFFSFLPGAAVGVAAAAVITPPATADNVVRVDPAGQRCACGCPHFHHVPVPELGISLPNHTHGFGHHPVAGWTFIGKPVCAWCGAPWNERGPWKGPTT